MPHVGGSLHNSNTSEYVPVLSPYTANGCRVPPATHCAKTTHTREKQSLCSMNLQLWASKLRISYSIASENM